MTRAMRTNVVLCVLLTLIAGAVAAYRVQHDARRWEPDAAIYLRMALQDRGRSPEAARTEANAFMVTTSEGANPESRGFYGNAPPPFYAAQFDLYRGRLLYPWLGAVLYGAFGPGGLQVISAIAYTLAVPLMFWTLLRVASGWSAAIGTLAFATARPVVEMATYAMTDEFALLLWIVVLAGMIRYQRRPSASALAVIGAASIALAFTRPAIYLPLGAALGAVAFARGAADRAVAWRLVAVTGAIAAGFVVVTAIVHGPGIAEQFRWQYEWQRATGAIGPAQSFAAWYVRALAHGFAEAFALPIVRDGAVFTIALAAIGAVLIRRSRLAGVLAGALVAPLVAILANPLEVVRTVELPWVPVLVILATVGFAAAVQRFGRMRRARPETP